MVNRKFLSTFLSITLALSSATSVGVVVSEAKTSADFWDLKDLDETTKAKFDALMNAGIFDGASEDGFSLHEEMNRAQFAKVAALIFNLEVDPSLKTSSFTDVISDDPSNGFALPYIEALKDAGITTGTTEATFNPAGNVTNEQLAVFLVRGLGMEDKAKESEDTGDVTVTKWARGYVDLALQMKLLQSTSDNGFGGKEPADPDQIVFGTYETKKTVEVTQPLEVSGAEFKTGNTLELTLTTQIDEASFDLSKITINGIPLDSSLDSFELSDDKKTIIIKLHNGFQLDSTKTPVIDVNGLKTLFGNELKNDKEVPIPVKVTEPPYTPPTVPEPSPRPAPVEPTPVEPNPTPVEPTPVEPNPTPVEPTPNPNLNPNPNQGPNY